MCAGLDIFGWCMRHPRREARYGLWSALHSAQGGVAKRCTSAAKHYTRLNVLFRKPMESDLAFYLDGPDDRSVAVHYPVS